MTLYKHYPSKDQLAIAFLRRREELWTHSWLQKEVERQASTPAGQLLAAFDALDKWFRRPDFEGCAFVNVMLEHKGEAHPVGKAAKAHLVQIRAFLKKLARDAGVRDADAFARQWQIVMMGAIVAACAGDRGAARRGKEMGSLLLAREGIA